MYHIKKLDSQITANPYVTFLLLQKKSFFKHKLLGHFKTDSLGHQTYRHYTVTYTSIGD